MAHKTNINGTNYEISGGKTLVNGTAYSISKGKTLVGGTAYEIPFTNGVAIKDLSVGTSVFDGSREYIIIHQGLPTSGVDSNMYDSSCNGTWLTTKLRCGPSVMMVGPGYLNTGIHTKLDSDYYNSVGSALKNAIKTVKIPYHYSGSGSAVYRGSNGLSCKFFLLSSYEVGITAEKSVNTGGVHEDGALLDYFTSDTRRIAYEYYNGVLDEVPYATRTLYANMTYFMSVSETGGQLRTGSSMATRPACIVKKATVLGVDESGKYCFI